MASASGTDKPLYARSTLRTTAATTSCAVCWERSMCTGKICFFGAGKKRTGTPCEPQTSISDNRMCLKSLETPEEFCLLKGQSSLIHSLKERDRERKGADWTGGNSPVERAVCKWTAGSPSSFWPTNEWVMRLIRIPRRMSLKLAILASFPINEQLVSFRNIHRERQHILPKISPQRPLF